MRRFAVIWAAILLLAVTLGILASAVFADQQHQNDGIRNFICFFAAKITSSPTQTAAQKHAAIIFFREATANLGVPECSVITGGSSGG
jgi:hypothetical protein